jgi:hypothetical protein
MYCLGPARPKHRPAERLAALGVKDNERNISNKVNRGTFSAVFFLQCMEAIGVQNIHLNGD